MGNQSLRLGYRGCYVAMRMEVNKLTSYLFKCPNSDLIVQLARLQTQVDDFLSPDFEIIDDGMDAAESWFDSDTIVASSFFPFAQTCDGGLFAYWKIGDTFKIVFLASECEGSRVIAEYVSQFLSLVARGSYNYAIDIAYVDQGDDWDEIVDATENFEQFRKYVWHSWNISPSVTPLTVIKVAMENSPSLMKWIIEWQAEKYGS